MGEEQKQCVERGAGENKSGMERQDKVGLGGAKKKIQEENQKAKERLTALKITSISRKMTPFVGPVSSLLFKA